MSDDQPQKEVAAASEYEPLEKPEFRPNVPGFLLEGASTQDRFIIETLSVLSQHAEWSTAAHIQTHNELRYTNGKVRHNKAVNDKLEGDVEALQKQVKSASSFLKIIGYLVFLWQYWLFRWLLLIGLGAVVLFLYPAYLSGNYHLSDVLVFIARLFMG